MSVMLSPMCHLKAACIACTVLMLTACGGGRDPGAGDSDSAPPVVSAGAPSGVLPVGTRNATLSAMTNEAATCRYATTAGTSYAGMTNTFVAGSGNTHSTPLTGLDNGRAHTYYLRCQDAAGNATVGDYIISFTVAAPSADTAPPSVPAGLTATVVSATQIDLAWAASTDNVGVAGYRIYRNAQATPIASVAGTRHSDTGLAGGTTYSFSVRAYDAAGNVSAASSSVSATTSAAVAASCTQTLSPGANVAGAVSSAAAGATICLNSGNYGRVNFADISKTGFVTIRSTQGRSATLSPAIANSRFLRFTSLTISGSSITNASSNVQITSSTFTDGLLINMRGSSKANYPLNILIDGSVFSNLGQALWEGRISIGDDDGANQPAMGVVISNNEIRDGCLSDGVQVVGGASGVQIGPGNVFSNIIQTNPITPTTPHCDSIQFYSAGPGNVIVGNWFKNVSVALQHHPGPTGTVFKDNVLSNVDQIQIHESPGFVFEHNTLHNLHSYFGFNHAGSWAGVVFRNNILSGNTQRPDGLIGAAISYQLCATAGQCGGSNQIVAAPGFEGGASPTTWAGFRLAPGSPGHQSGSDAKDRGTTYYGPAAP